MDNSLRDKVLEAVDIVELVGERVDLTRKGREFVGLCPFHQDHRPSLFVSPRKQIFKCWSCGAGGDALSFVQKYERVDFREALAMLARRAGIEVTTSATDRRASQLREQIQAAVNWAQERFRNNLVSTEGGRQARDYALRRGLNEQTIERFGLGYAPDGRDGLLRTANQAGLQPEILNQAGLIGTSERGTAYDRFRNRLIFPITDRMGRTIAFGGRTLGDDPAKYLNSPETVLFSKSRVLYGLHLARRAIEHSDAAIIVEGYMDAVMLAQYGFENVLATLGTALTDAHVKLLRPLAGTLYLCFDGDDAGVRAAERAVEIALKTQTQVRVVLLESGQDPADSVTSGGAAAFDRRLKASVDALGFKWSQALEAFDQSDQRGRRRAIEEYIQFVASVAVTGGVDPLEQDLLIGRLSDLLGVPPEEVFDLLSRQKRRERRAARPPAGADGASAYESTIAGLSGGLVAAVEEVLGLLICGPRHWQWVDDSVARGVGYSETWQHLYGVLLDVHEDVGKYSIREVVARCEDSATCELVDRAAVRATGADPGGEVFVAARDRLASELNVLRMSNLRKDLRDQATEEGTDGEVFRSLRDLARAQHGCLPAERRWNADTAR